MQIRFQKVFPFYHLTRHYTPLKPNFKPNENILSMVPSCMCTILGKTLTLKSAFITVFALFIWLYSSVVESQKLHLYNFINSCKPIIFKVNINKFIGPHKCMNHIIYIIWYMTMHIANGNYHIEQVVCFALSSWPSKAGQSTRFGTAVQSMNVGQSLIRTHFPPPYLPWQTLQQNFKTKLSLRGK